MLFKRPRLLSVFLLADQLLLPLLTICVSTVVKPVGLKCKKARVVVSSDNDAAISSASMYTLK